MVNSGRWVGDDVGLGRNHGSFLFSAPRARPAVRVQGRGRHRRTGSARALSFADREKRNQRRGTGGEQMTDTQSNRASTAADLTIITPEGVLFRLPLAGPASRLYAMLLDVVIVLGVVNGIGL